MNEEQISHMITSVTRMSLEALRLQHQLQMASLQQQVTCLQAQIRLLERSAV